MKELLHKGFLLEVHCGAVCFIENTKNSVIGFRRGVHMFDIKDKVVYGVIGVCQIEDINTPPIKGIDGEYYFLQPVYDSKGLIYSPVKSTKVLMRSVMEKGEAKTLVERAKNCKTDEVLNEAVMAYQYDDMIKSQNALEYMHLIRGLYNIKNERAKDLRKMKSADSRILITARKLLYGELAISLEQDYDEITEMMDEYLGQR